MKTKILLIVLFTAWFMKSNSQSHGRIEGYVYNSNDSLSLISAHVIIKAGDKTYGAVTDENGHYIVKAIEPGTYTLEISYSGFAPKKIIKVPVNSNRTTSIGKTYLGFVEIIGAEVFGYKLIQEDGGVTKALERKEIEKLPVQNSIPTMLAYLSSEFIVSDDNREIHFRGSRDGETAYYVDGVRVSSPDGIPSAALRSFTLYAGGIPAKYGDFLGGVVVIETMSYNEWVEERNRMEELWRQKYAQENSTNESEIEFPGISE